MKKCPNCGRENGDDLKFCGNCGTSLDSESINPEGSNEELSPAPVQSSATNTQVVPNKNATTVKTYKKTSGMCIAGLVLGILGILFLLSTIGQVLAVLMALVGLPLSIAGLIVVKKKNLNGKGMAIGGLVTNAFVLIFAMILFFVGIVEGLNKASKIDKSNAFGGTCEIFGLELTFGDDYEIIKNNSYDRSEVPYIISIPVHVKNISSDSADPAWKLIIDYFNPKGVEIDDMDSRFDDGIYSCGELRSQAESDFKFYFPYDGDGTYHIKMEAFNIWNDDEIELGFVIDGKGIPSNTDSTKNTSNNETNATTETTEQAVDSFEIVDSNLLYRTDSIGYRYYFAVAVVENTGNTYLDVDSYSFDFEDSNGHYLMSSNWTIEATPSVIAPGELSYVYCSGSIDEEMSLDNGFVLVANISCSRNPSSAPFVDYEISDTDIRNQDFRGAKITGRVSNTSEQNSPSRFNVYAVLFNSENEVIGILDDYVDVNAGATSSFNCSETIWDPDASEVDHYNVIARAVP